MTDNPEKPFHIKDRVKSFGYAFKGIGYVMRTQHNIWIHMLITLVVLAFGFWFDISKTEWMFVVFAIGFVLVSELFNTAIELLVDLVSPEHNPQAGRVKDIAAGAVLVSAITAALIGLFIFLPKILSLCF